MKKKKHESRTTSKHSDARKKRKTAPDKKASATGKKGSKKGIKGISKAVKDEPVRKIKLFKKSKKTTGKGNKSGIDRIKKSKSLEKGKNKGDNKSIRGNKITPSKVKKIRAQHLFLITLPQKGFINKVRAIQAMNFSFIDKYISKVKDIPVSCVIVFKIKKPGEKGYFYQSNISPFEMHIEGETIKQFIAQLLSDYNNNTIDIIEEKYDGEGKQYNIVSCTVRLNF